MSLNVKMATDSTPQAETETHRMQDPLSAPDFSLSRNMLNTASMMLDYGGVDPKSPGATLSKYPSLTLLRRTSAPDYDTASRNRSRDARTRRSTIRRRKPSEVKSVESNLVAQLPGIDKFAFAFRFGKEHKFVSSSNGCHREAVIAPQELFLPDISRLKVSGPQPLRFFDLPFDVRRIIYDLLFRWDRNIKFHAYSRIRSLQNADKLDFCPQRNGPACPVALMQTCRTINNEILATLYGDNYFEFYTGKITPNLFSMHDIFYRDGCFNLKHIIQHRIPCPAKVIRGAPSRRSPFEKHFSAGLRPLKFCSSLIDASMQFEIQSCQLNGVAFPIPDPRTILEFFLNRWMDSKGLNFFHVFDIGPVTCVRAVWRGIWLAEPHVWTVCMSFVRQGHTRPSSHRPDVDLMKSGRWNVEKMTVQNVECFVFIQAERT